MDARPLALMLGLPTALTAALVGILAAVDPPGAFGGGGQDPLSEPFRGVTTDGTVQPGLFPIEATGVSTGPVREAAERFLAGLTPAQREAVEFPVDDVEWRMWYNVHRGDRQGVSLRQMDDTQRDLAFGLLRAALSADGLKESRDIMRLNGYVARLLDNLDDYGDDLYFFTVMGEPSDTEPWGWQLDGHHLDINYFVLGDQVVMTPTFMGSEPVAVDSGPLAGTSVLQDEQDLGLAFVRSLTADQRRQALSQEPKARSNARAQAFQDNLVLPYEGLPVRELDAAGRQRLVELIGRYVGRMDDGHAAVKLDEVRAHLDDTYFLWIGDTSEDAVFYYRIQSPVVLIEFDHQGPIALPGDRGVPSRAHVHTVVRTPNGNDYGKDLLREHYEAHRNDPAHGHVSEEPPGRPVRPGTAPRVGG